MFFIRIPMHILFSLLTADVPEIKVQSRQAELMRLACEPTVRHARIEEERLWYYFRNSDDTNPDPCTWRGVECHDDVVRTLIFQQMWKLQSKLFTPGPPKPFKTLKQEWIVEMRWLPSTVQHIQFQSIKLHRGWSTAALPRELRYMYLKLCSQRFSYDNSRHMDLQKLPRRMEELIILESWWVGPLLVAGLPATMRLCVFENLGFPRVYIDNAEIPASLKRIFVRQYNMDIKYKEVNGKGSDVIRPDFRQSDWQDVSEHWHAMYKKSGQIQRELIEEDIPGFRS